MFNKNFVWASAMALAVGVQAAAWGAPQSDSEIRSAIQSELRARHPEDTPEWWRELGPKAPGVIISMIEESQDSYRRIRLMGALAWFSDDPQAVEYLKQGAEKTDEDLERQTAIRSVGISQGEREIEWLSKYLKHADPQTRLAAAESLKRIPGPQARARLEQYLKEEKIPGFAARIQGAPGPTMKPLKPVATSEDKLHPAFEGVWRGYWMRPSDTGQGMTSENAVLKLTSEGASRLKVELTLSDPQGKKPSQTAVLGVLQGKASRVGGSVPSKALISAAGSKAKKSRFPNEVGVDAEMAEQAGTFVLEIKVPQMAGIFFLRKDAP